jgi:signal transduction histidine kinase
MRIRRRLALYGTAVAFAGMGLFSLGLAALVSGGAARDQDELLTGLAASAADRVEQAADPGLGTRPFFTGDIRTSDDPFLLVLGDDGTERFASATNGGEPVRVPAAVILEALGTGASIASFDVASVPVRVAAARWERAGESGVTVAGQPLRVLQQQSEGFGAFLVVLLVIILIAVAIVSWLVTGRALRPLVALTATADEIGRTGDLSRRLPPTRAKDEVGSLTASFNGMLDRLAGAQQRQADALAAQRRFVADASHELRTPLTSIRTNAGFLQDHPDADAADRTAALDDLAAEADRMTRLVDGLLLLARADAGAPLERRPVDVAGIAIEVARRARRPDRETRAETAGAVVVDGDLDALTRLVWILVDNALRHGGGAVTIRVDHDGTRASLAVRDEGPGFPPGSTERVFERFYRADAARSGQGAGLGLSIARTIAEAHGGIIRAANAPEGGAVVTVELPAA